MSEESVKLRRALELWFFRDLADEQRYKLAVLCGLPGEAWPVSHIHQKHFLRTVLAALSPAMGEETGAAELVRQLLACVHQPAQKAGSNYWHVTRGRHVEFGRIISQLHILAAPKENSNG